MTGIIVLWSGAIVDIPPGWHLCDGTQGTPDLRNRFIVGAGDTYAVDASGGATSHDHTASSVNDIHTHAATAANDSHSHDFVGEGHDHILDEGPNFINSYPNGDYDNNTLEEEADGTTDPDTHTHVLTVPNDTHNHAITVNSKTELPPYYALAYIMKL